MHRILWSIALLLTTLGGAVAEGEHAGEFDYYVLALSWSPSWCRAEGADSGSPQCAPGRQLGWILHGLWPQYDVGWPSYCKGAARNPTRADTAAMADITGTAGLAWHTWNKHGRCTGLTSDAYFTLSRSAYEAISRPRLLRQLGRDVALPATVIEDAFLEANPRLTADMITITCRDNAIREVRICLSRELEPRICGRDVRRDCQASGAYFPAVR